MDVYEQIEWHGMAEKGSGRRDPMTSVVEFNTQPGRETFQKIPARQNYLTGRIPAPAIRISNIGSFYTLCEGPTVRTYANVTAQVMEKNYLSYSAQSIHHICACFKHDDYSTLDSNQQPIVFGYGDYGNTGIRLTKTSGSWRCQYQKYDTGSDYVAHTFTADMLEGSWYWADGAAQGLTADVALYKDGSAAAIESARIAFSHNTNLASKTYYVGGSNVVPKSFWGGEIAYAAASIPLKTVFPTAWHALPGTEDFYGFYIHNPRHTYLPAQILETPGSMQSVWAEFPPPFWEESGVSTPLNAIGLRNWPGKNYIFDSQGIELFRDLTVFLFYVQGANHEYDFIRNEDSSFRVWTEGQQDRINVWWTPENPSAGVDTYGHQIRTESTANVISSSTAQWFAIELDPTNQTTADSVTVYECDIWGTGETWTDITSPSQARAGGGIASDMLNDTWYLMNSRTRYAVDLMDFRVIVGDQDWKTNHTINTMITSIPKGLRAWMNNVEATDLINEEKVQILKADNFADVANWPMACSDRVDGLFRYYLSPYHSRVGRGGCEHLIRGPMPYVEDIISDSTGQVSFTTDAYYYDAGVVKPQFATRCPNRSLIAPMGTHRYIVNNSPLQLVRDQERQVGIPPFYIENKGPTPSAGTVHFNGALTWNSTYQYVLTLYDPLTGDEGPAIGPYRFVTASAPATTTVDWGTPGCAFFASARLYLNKNASDLNVKAYRYSTVQGVYYYESMVPIGPGTYSSAEASWLANVSLPFRHDEELLLLGAEVNTENRVPPEHSVSTIYDARGFYVESVRQSRIYFSRRYQIGTVPRSNLIWTDEGVGGAILGFLDSPNGLMLLRERSIWLVPPFATDDTAWAYPLHPSIGCVSGSCAVWAGGLLWWASPLGLHSWDGQGQPQNHSQRVSGYDKQVWDHAPRRTVAYYDSKEFKVVIACDGTGLSIDVRTGAVAIVSAPERCYLEIQSKAYSGPLYGHAGGLFKQADGNASLSLSTAGAVCGNVQPVSTAGAYTALSWFWANAGMSASHTIGVIGNATAFQAGATYLSVTSDIGRTFTSINNGYTDLWTVTIADTVGMGTTASGILISTDQTLLDQCGIEAIPFYYKSQPAYLGRSRTDHYFERLDFYTDDEAGTTDGAAHVTFTSWIPGQTTAMSVSVTAAVISPNDAHEMTLTQRGNRFQYELFDPGTASLPNILEMGVHFRSTRERGRSK